MNNAQMLLRKLIDQAGGPAEEGFVLVLDGEGLENPPAEVHTSKALYRVRRAVTEIGVRHVLWQSKGAPVVLIVPEDLAKRLPPDLVRRARNQRIHALSVNEVLSVVLGVRVVGAEEAHLQELALENVDALGMMLATRTLPTVVDRKLLVELLVDVGIGKQVRSRPPAELFADWLRDPPSWQPALRRLVQEILPSLHGDEGRLLAWALEDEERLHPLFIHGALLTIEDAEVPQQVWGPLWAAARRSPIELDPPLVRAAACRLVEGALGALGDAAVGLLDKADSLARRTLTPTQLQRSRVLPLAFRERCAALAQRAATGGVVSADDVDWLKRHRAAPQGQAEIAVLEAMGRLTRYLDRPAPDVGDVLAQVEEYQRHGAFADLAAMQLRRRLAGLKAHHKEAQAVLERYRGRRDEQNHAFAQTLAAGYVNGLHRKGIVPLHRVARWVLGPRWTKDPSATVYLVVLDGCSYPVFLDLLQELSQDAGFPVGMVPDERGSVRGLPALSPLPTITSHARGALFLGEIPKDPLVAETLFRDDTESKTDKARFGQNHDLGTRTRRLFLKGDLGDPAGLFESLRDPEVQLVGAVFNAIDDQIGSAATGSAVRLGADGIVGFKPSLQEALRAGRQVLLTADHGHTPFVDKAGRVGGEPTSRFVELGEGKVVPSGFLEIDVAQLGGAPGRKAFAWKMGAYNGLPQLGFHGGCSLEEMAVPMAWLKRGGVQADEPDWWLIQHHVAPMPTSHLEPLPTPPPLKTKAPVLQPDLFQASNRVDVVGLPAEVIAGLDEDEKTVLVMLAENGSARASELATVLDRNPMRVNGLMARLRRTLANAGVPRFSAETLPSGETQYRYLEPGR